MPSSTNAIFRTARSFAPVSVSGMPGRSAKPAFCRFSARQRAKSTWVSRSTAIWRTTPMVNRRNSPRQSHWLSTDTDPMRALGRDFPSHGGKGAGTEISPLVLSISGFGDDRDGGGDARRVYSPDGLLKRKSKSLIEDVAFTIFPQRLWEIARGIRKAALRPLQRAFPRLPSDRTATQWAGSLLRAFAMYGRGPCDRDRAGMDPFAIDSRTGVRRSMLQGTTFDPSHDDVRARSSVFHVSAHPFRTHRSRLTCSTRLRNSTEFNKAYGNYLRPRQFGAFMAQMNVTRKLIRLNVMVGIAKLERITKV